MFMKTIAILISALALATPIAGPAAAAQRFDLVVTGTLSAGGQPVGTTPVAGLNFGTGDSVSARWRIDTSTAGFTSLAPVGGAGSAGAWTGIFSGGEILTAGNGGANNIVLAQTPQSFGALILVDNGNIGSPLRLDQIALNDGLSFITGSATYGYSISGAPGGIFVNNINYARNAVAVGTDPSLLTTLDLPDLITQWQPTTLPLSFGLTFGSGAPTTQAEFLAAPRSVFSVINQQARIEILSTVPEPASWAMLIAGFGLVGAAARRRRGLTSVLG
jgi:hypothetical protein